MQNETAPAIDLRPFWLSWYATAEQLAAFEYHGPWWITGYDADDRRTCCAAVMAMDEDAAKDVIASAFDNPTVFEWGFYNERDNGWSPFYDRFVRADWMQWPFPGPDGRPRS